ncbi:MAG TPA: protein-disulfide reductase DsbD domain-containing protein [Chitinophagaceae bacterium]|nr:protein-disulfide reductase DsbD domain-containing protein [Chitinophagaceae bacterium]
MKRSFGMAIVLLMGMSAMAQLNPVNWTFTAKRTGDKMIEVEMKATIDEDWHLYSQIQPEDAVILPTTFIINPNPLFTLDGKIIETGKLEKFTDKKLGFSANQYSNTVTFVQRIKLRGNAKTNVTGTVEFQTCDNKKCLPPRRVSFSVPVK